MLKVYTWLVRNIGQSFKNLLIFPNIVLAFGISYMMSLNRSSRVSPQGTAFEMLEPCEVKVSRTVLRGLGAGNSPRLPGPIKI